LAKHKVVVVGGGFGGIKAALNLAKNHIFDVTLVYDHPDFRYYPTLFQAATGKKRAVASIPITEIFAHLPINLVQDSIVDLDRQKHEIITKSNKKFPYDALILALGVQTNYFNIEGLEKFSFGIKTIEDAERLKQHLHQQITVDKKPDLNYVVVGGGPTGIELAAMLPSYIDQILRHHGIAFTNLHIDLVEAAPRLLPRATKLTSRKVTRRLKHLGVKLYLNTAVKAETVDELTINDKPIRSHTVIWTAGMMNHPFFASHGFQMSTKTKVRVDQYLQAEPGIYVIGDNADTPYSGMAQTAIHDGVFVADNLTRISKRLDPKPYLAKKPIYVYAVGPNWSAVEWAGVSFYGRVGAWLRKASDLIGFHDYEPWKLATERFIDEYENEESCPVCASTTQNE
jgi:NADH dehydrogenase